MCSVSSVFVFTSLGLEVEVEPYDVALLEILQLRI